METVLVTIDFHMKNNKRKLSHGTTWEEVNVNYAFEDSICSPNLFCIEPILISLFFLMKQLNLLKNAL